MQADFLRYIEYELNLEQLRKIRKKQSENQKSTFGDRSIVQNIHFIFQRATKRFHGDIPLWVQYLDFCESTKSTKQFSKTVTKALQLHPRAEGLWIRAASKQWEIYRDMRTARHLLQRALRLNRRSRKLFLEYFRLECLNISHLAERREVRRCLPSPSTVSGGRPSSPSRLTLLVRQALGLQQFAGNDDDAVSPAAAQDSSDSSEAAPEVDAIAAATAAAATKGMNPTATPQEIEAKKQFFNGAVPFVVYSQVSKTCFRASFFFLSPL